MHNANGKSKKGHKASNRRGSSDASDNYKTEMCRTYQKTGYCTYENICQFAHGIEDLRPRRYGVKYKTWLCKNYHLDGDCRFGSRCNFIHDEKRVQIKEREYWLLSPTENVVRVEVVKNSQRAAQLASLMKLEKDRAETQTSSSPTPSSSPILSASNTPIFASMSPTFSATSTYSPSLSASNPSTPSSLPHAQTLISLPSFSLPPTTVNNDIANSLNGSYPQSTSASPHTSPKPKTKPKTKNKNKNKNINKTKVPRPPASPASPAHYVPLPLAGVDPHPSSTTPSPSSGSSSPGFTYTPVYPQVVYYTQQCLSPVFSVPYSIESHFQNISMMNSPQLVSQTPIFVCPSSSSSFIATATPSALASPSFFNV